MNTNELLRKRVIVTAYYPNCPFEVGQILKQAHELSMLAGSYHDGGMYVMDTEVEKSTANFQQLQWWEKREERDLPSYFKKSFSKEVIRKEDVFNLKDMISRGLAIDSEGNIAAFSSSFFNHYIPATEQEYTEYVNSKNKNT